MESADTNRIPSQIESVSTVVSGLNDIIPLIFGKLSTVDIPTSPFRQSAADIVVRIAVRISALAGNAGPAVNPPSYRNDPSLAGVNHFLSPSSGPEIPNGRC